MSVCVCFYGFASVPRQPLCRCVLQRLSVADFKLPCLKLWAHTLKASLPIYERFVGFASCKAFGRSFQASLPCLPLPQLKLGYFHKQQQFIAIYLQTTTTLGSLAKGELLLLSFAQPTIEGSPALILTVPQSL